MPVFDAQDPVFRTTLVNGKSYRLISLRDSAPPSVPFVSVEAQSDATQAEDEPGLLEELNECEAVGGCVVNNRGEWTKTIAVDDKLWKKIKKDLSEFDSVQIFFRNDVVELRSSSQEDLLYLYTEIAEKIDQLAKPTHFICIPLNQHHIVAQFQQFRDSLDPSFSSLSSCLLPSASKLHITLCVLTLTEPAKVAAATAAFEEFRDRYYSGRLSEGSLIELSVRGMRCLQDDPAQARVLYTGDFSPLDVSGRIHALCDLLFACLMEKGVLTREQLANQRVLDSAMKRAELKLHATVFNAKYGRLEDGNFDATAVLGKLGDSLDFGTAELAEIRMCELSGSAARGPAGDGFYCTVATLDL